MILARLGTLRSPPQSTNRRLRRPPIKPSGSIVYCLSFRELSAEALAHAENIYDGYFKQAATKELAAVGSDDVRVIPKENIDGIFLLADFALQIWDVSVRSVQDLLRLQDIKLRCDTVFQTEVGQLD